MRSAMKKNQMTYGTQVEAVMVMSIYRKAFSDDMKAET